MRSKYLQITYVFATVLFLYLFFCLEIIADNYSMQSFNLLPKTLFNLLWPLSFSILLSLKHIRNWFERGKLRIDFGYLVIAGVLLLITMIGFVKPQVLPFPFYPAVFTSDSVSSIIFWYSLIHGFSNEVWG